MKGVNASKIAALAAGAVLLASSVVSAGVMYENLELVNPNGQPTAKVVVGSSAQVSDGIAAANIAAVLANKAYKSSTLSASVSGTATCSATGGSEGGTGGCEVSNEKALIEIIVPGQLANAYQFKTLITDRIDRTLQNRVSSNSEDQYSTSLTANDINTVLSPLRGSSSTKGTYLYKIGEENFLPFKTRKNIQDKQGGPEFSYIAEQSFWVGTNNEDYAVGWDSTLKEVVAKPVVAVYSLWFGGNDYGIPVCTKVSETGNGDWSWCNSASSHATANHRLEIPFLGSNWVISSMTTPSTSLPSSTAAITGGTIKLAKEAKYDIINVGGVIDAGDFKIRLSDISVAVGSSNEHPAILDILDSNDAVIGQIKVNEGETYSFTQSSTGKSIKIHVYRTAPGFTLSAKWAELAVYSDEITLQHGKPYNLESSNGKNYKFKVSLLWKNRDYVSGGSTAADSLRQIVIFNEDSFIGEKYTKGKTFNFLTDPAVFKLTYEGLDLSESDYVPIQIESLQTTLPISANNQDCTTKVEYTAKLIRFSSDGPNFGSGSGTDLLGTYKIDNFYFDPIGNVDFSVANPTQSQRFTGTQEWVDAFNDLAPGGSGALPAIIYRPDGFDCYLVSDITVNTEIDKKVAPSSTNTIRFDYAGSDSGAYGLLFFSLRKNAGDGLGETAKLSSMPALSLSNYLDEIGIAFQEDAGKRDTLTQYPVTTAIPVFGTQSDNYFKFKSASASTLYTYYSGVVKKGATLTGNIVGTTDYDSNELPFYTERGSMIGSYTDSSFSIKVAKKVGKPTFTFSFTDTVATESGEVWEAKEGDTKTLDNGVKLKLKEIQETVGSCKVSAGGAAPTCTVDMSGVSAKIMPDNAATVQAVQPYDIKGTNLVISDSEAASVGGVQILVGGPVVNSATKAALENSPVNFDVTNVYVKAIGNKIVVAGKTASDTMQAANEFISKLTVN
ncbi:MAG: S-layer protein [Candidatus Anstonellaceae archaeon]